MLKFLKMTVAEDVIITDVVVVDVVLDQDAKVLEVLAQDVKVLAAVGLEVTETLLQEKVVSEATEIHLVQEEKVVSEAQLQEAKEVQTELQDVLKALVILQDQEDQEEINTLIS
eukprot:TRINITY_DN17299_c0_g1_i1.p2 TRINITY_DN17299_c0_g1~~TRINITY_DN17299_c0_g1_i1.p2  ORF type:complete len:114 (-),score=2.04 TRINITY_DN17299_c0_g1_i1:21-362(-)